MEFYRKRLIIWLVVVKVVGCIKSNVQKICKGFSEYNVVMLENGKIFVQENYIC